MSRAWRAVVAVVAVAWVLYAAAKVQALIGAPALVYTAAALIIAAATFTVAAAARSPR